MNQHISPSEAESGPTRRRFLEQLGLGAAAGTVAAGLWQDAGRATAADSPADVRQMCAEEGTAILYDARMCGLDAFEPRPAYRPLC